MSSTDTLTSSLQAMKLAGPVSINIMDPRARFNLRANPSDVKKASKIFGVDIPAKLWDVKTDGSKEAVCIGPDEWVLQASENESNSVTDAFANAYSDFPHSLVDISDREVAISISGEQAAELLSVGYPADLDDLAVGQGHRTIFDTATVVLYRDGENEYRLETWRSFLPHVWDLLNIANAELATEI